MIRLNFQNVTREAIGPENGLNLDQQFEAYREQIHDSVTRLYQSKDEAGRWTAWLNLGYDRELIDSITRYADSIRGQFEDLVILGIGGSSLGGLAMLRALLHPYWNELPAAKRNGLPRFHFIENVDADQIAGLMDILDLNTTLFNVITKSGTTAETMSAFMFIKARLDEAFGPEKAARHIVATTDPKKGILRDIVNQEGYQSFIVPDDVGGRFSVFSAVGLLPAALCGVDIAQLQQGIRDMDALLQNPDIHHNPAAQNALIQYLYFQQGKPISVFMPYSFRLASVSDWYVQLWAESLGKRTDRDGRSVFAGPTPLRAVGVTDQHSQIQLYNEGPFDKVVTFVEVEETEHSLTIPNAYPQVGDLAYLGDQPFNRLMRAEFESTRASLTRNNRPNLTITLPKITPYSFAQLLYMLEVQTAIAGDLFHIDPFDQPGVELAKKYTYALMGRKGYEDLIPEAKGERPAVPAGS